MQNPILSSGGTGNGYGTDGQTWSSPAPQAFTVLTVSRLCGAQARMMRQSPDALHPASNDNTEDSCLQHEIVFTTDDLATAKDPNALDNAISTTGTTCLNGLAADLAKIQVLGTALYSTGVDTAGAGERDNNLPTLAVCNAGNIPIRCGPYQICVGDRIFAVPLPDDLAPNRNVAPGSNSIRRVILHAVPEHRLRQIVSLESMIHSGLSGSADGDFVKHGRHIATCVASGIDRALLIYQILAAHRAPAPGSIPIISTGDVASPDSLEHAVASVNSMVSFRDDHGNGRDTLDVTTQLMCEPDEVIQKLIDGVSNAAHRDMLQTEFDNCVGSKTGIRNFEMAFDIANSLYRNLYLGIATSNATNVGEYVAVNRFVC